MTTLAQLLYGIRQEESGGNYHITNSAGAYGAYQVMYFNIAGWTREALGYSMSPSQFLADPAAQDKVAAYKLGQYMRQYGSAEAAAAVWFSGRPDPYSSASDGNTTVRQYVANVIAMANRSNGVNVAGGSYSGNGGAATTTATLDPETLAGMYGLASATINANGELKRLFNQAVAGQWSADRFTAALKNTNWWRTTSDSARQFFMLKTSDPATFNAKWQQAAMHANDIGVKLGIWNMASEGTSFGGRMDQLLRRAALHVLQDGWNDAQLTDWLGQYVRVNNGVMWGQAGEQWDALHQYAYQQGMQYQWQWYYNAARQIVSGQTTLENAQATIRHQAAARYGAWADQINAGQNVIDLASPYIKAVSDILEVPQGSVDLTNKYVQQAMTGKTQTSLWQFEDTLRNDPTWVKTDNARESIMGVAHTVLKDFGLAY